jgi:hypothetical protein
MLIYILIYTDVCDYPKGEGGKLAAAAAVKDTSTLRLPSPISSPTTGESVSGNLLRPMTYEQNSSCTLQTNLQLSKKLTRRVTNCFKR